jgi:hypothetical protein
MKRLSLALGLAAGTLFFGAPAWACSNPQSVRAIIHSALPRPLPANTVVADVELGSGDVDVLHRTGIRARIRTLVQGRSSGRHLILRLPAGSTCDL